MKRARTEKTIGCVDGAVVRVVSDSDGAHLHCNGGVAHLSRSGAAALASALAPGASEASSAVPPRPRSPGDSRRMGAGVNPSVGDLITEGYLDEGATLTLSYRGHEHTARVYASGEIEHNGVRHGSLSAAARAATGATAMNGGAAWHTDDGPIGDLRWWLRADRFPGDGHSYGEPFAKRMRMVARWWVDHTLSNGLDPGTPDEAEIEVLLGGNGYAESTLEQQRRHLRNWFYLYGRGPASDH